MKGYYTNAGFMGFVPWLGRYILFSTESDYVEFFDGRIGDSNAF